MDEYNIHSDSPLNGSLDNVVFEIIEFWGHDKNKGTENWNVDLDQNVNEEKLYNNVRTIL